MNVAHPHAAFGTDTEPSELLAATYAALKPRELPPEVLGRVELFALDTIAVMIAGTTAQGSATALGFLDELAGNGSSTVLLADRTASMPDAAFHNAVCAHSRELDDTHDEGSVHVFASALPAALAVAEARRSSGADFLAALVAGADMSARVALSVRNMRGWHLTGVAGVFGSAVAAGRLLGLTACQMQHAIGIAYTQAAGNLQSGRDGALTKRMHPAFAARAGVTSALLAYHGATGPTNVFNGQYSFHRLYDPDVADDERRWHVDGSDYRREDLVEELGSRFEVMRLSVKPYASCRFTHAPVRGALELRPRIVDRLGDINTIEVAACARSVQDYGKPFAFDERAAIRGQFSIPYTVAAALATGEVSPGSFERAVLDDNRVRDLVTKTRVVRNPQARLKLPVALTIVMNDGTRENVTVTSNKGSPEDMLTDAEFAQKVRGCLQLSRKPLPPGYQESLSSAVRELRGAPDISHLTQFLQ